MGLNNSFEKKGQAMRRGRMLGMVLNILSVIGAVIVVFCKFSDDINVRYNILASWVLISTLVLLVYNLYMSWASRNISTTMKNSTIALMNADAESKVLIEAISTNYDLITLVNVNDGSVKFIKLSTAVLANMQDEFSKKTTHDNYISAYAQRYISEDKRDEFISSLSQENVCAAMNEKNKFVYSFVEKTDKGTRLIQLIVKWYNKEDGIVACSFIDVSK